MKRAKIMLTSIAILAVVGGALAFKAKTFGAGNVYCKFDNSGICDLVDYTTTYQGQQPASTTNPCKDALTTSTFTTETCGIAQPTTTVYVTNP